MCLRIRTSIVTLAENPNQSHFMNPGSGSRDNVRTSSTGRWTIITWWRHQMEKFSALLALCAGNSPVSGEFPAQRPVTRSFDVFFDLRVNKRLSKHSWGWWFETQSRSLWRHRNDIHCKIIAEPSTTEPDHTLKRVLYQCLYEHLSHNAWRIHIAFINRRWWIC